MSCASTQARFWQAVRAPSTLHTHTQVHTALSTMPAYTYTSALSKCHACIHNFILSVPQENSMYQHTKQRHTLSWLHAEARTHSVPRENYTRAYNPDFRGYTYHIRHLHMHAFEYARIHNSRPYVCVRPVILTSMCAVDYLHRHCIVHRDIKCANCLRKCVSMHICMRVASSTSCISTARVC